MKLIFNKNISLAAVLLLLLTSCNEKKVVADAMTEKTEESATLGLKQIRFSTDQYKLADIETGKIEMRNLSNVIKLNGVIDVEPKGMATVSAPLGGYIKSAGLLPGQPVKKGQVLARIENQEIISMQQEYLESKGELEYLKEEYKRQEKLREEDINSAKTFQKATSEYKVMKARINGLEQKLALAGINISVLKNGKISRTANLYSPISGYIKASNVSIGKYVNPEDILFEIINPDEVHLALNAFEKDMAILQEGQNVRFSLANEDGFNRSAKIFLIGKSSEANRVISVHCHIKKEDEKGLLPGMYVKAWIEIGANKQTSVPTEAIVKLEGKDYLIFQKSESSDGYLFQFEQIKREIEQEGFTSISLPKTIQIEGSILVVKNAYSILSALINSEESE